MSVARNYLEPDSKSVRFVNDVMVRLCNRFLFPGGIIGTFVDHDDSIIHLQNDVKSVIRWGDGESLILLGGDIYFQPYSLPLRTRLLEIIRKYSEQCGYYLAVPTQYLASSSQKLRNTRRGKLNDFDIWRASRFVFWKYFPKNIEYLDAFLFKGSTIEQLSEVRKIFSKFSRFVVVSSEPQNVDALFKDNMPAAEYSKIVIPAKNAFSTYGDILDDILAELDKLSAVNKEEILIMLSAGPCAKVLAFDLTQQGHIALDVGKLFRCWT